MLLPPVLLLRGVSQAALILQRLYSLRIIPRNPKFFEGLSFVINHSLIFDALLFALLLVIPLTLILRHLRVTESYRNRAELRKLKAEHRRVRHWAAFFALLLALDLSSITALKSYAGREIPLSAPEDYAIEDGRIVVPLESLQDEHLHRYEYTAKDGIKIARQMVGNYVTSLEMPGVSVTLMRVDDELLKLFDAPADTVAWK